jgi:hypothetical protein
VAAYVFSLDYSDAANWEICRREGVIGVRQSPSGQASARALQEGDVAYVWRSGGRRPGSGLIAKIEITGKAKPAATTHVPWPSPDSFTFVIPFRLIKQLDQPVPDTFPNNQKGVRFRIQNTDLQKSLRPVSDESEQLLEAYFTSSTSDPDGAVPVAVPGGWSTDQELIREVEEAAVAASRSHLASHGWREVRDCQRDGCGYDFIYEHPSHGSRLVEVKRTAGSAVRFQLTRLEHGVLSRDPSGRIYVVLNALDDPEVRELDWTDVEDLGVRPSGYEVGTSDGRAER